MGKSARRLAKQIEDNKICKWTKLKFSSIYFVKVQMIK